MKTYTILEILVLLYIPLSICIVALTAWFLRNMKADPYL